MSFISAAIVGVSFSLTCFVALGFVSVAWDISTAGMVFIFSGGG